MQACRAKRDVVHCPLGLGFRNWAARVMACLWSDTRLLALTWPRHNDAEAGWAIAPLPMSSVRPDRLTVGVRHVRGL